MLESGGIELQATRRDLLGTGDGNVGSGKVCATELRGGGGASHQSLLLHGSRPHGNLPLGTAWDHLGLWHRWALERQRRRLHLHHPRMLLHHPHRCRLRELTVLLHGGRGGGGVGRARKGSGWWAWVRRGVLLELPIGLRGVGDGLHGVVELQASPPSVVCSREHDGAVGVHEHDRLRGDVDGWSPGGVAHIEEGLVVDDDRCGVDSAG